MNKLNLDYQAVIEDYQSGLSTVKLAKKYNCCSSTIRNLLIKNGCTRRNNRYYRTKWNFNHDFFGVIDTERKAYWLGFMYADGNIRMHGNQPIIQFRLYDKEMIEKFIDDINGNMPIKWYTSSGCKMPYYGVYLTSQKMFDDLCHLGCVPNKSLILKFPSMKQVPMKFMNHFIRGYFDGDGSVHILNKKFIKNPVSNPIIAIKHKLEVSFSGTKEFLYYLSYFLGFVSIKKENRRASNTYYCNTINNETVKWIYKFMYQDASVYLKRKKDVFDNYFK
jgi:hypothetical protein